MATLKSRLVRALTDRFAGADVKLTGFTKGKRVRGTVVWDKFEGQPQIDRQVALRRAINDALPGDERSQVSFILTVTPVEMDSISRRD